MSIVQNFEFDEKEESIDLVRLHDNKKNKQSCWSRYIRELKSRRLTLPTMLLALYNCPVIMCLIFLQSILYRLVSPLDSTCFFTDLQLNTSQDGLVVAIVLQYLFLYLAYPLTGWLADTRLGRGRVIFLSVWFCWFGMLLQVSSFCIQYGLCGVVVSIAKYGISGVALVLMTLGTAGYLANVLPYGMDLLMSESNTKIRAFIHWNTWSIFIGSSYNYGALIATTALKNPNLMMLSSLSTFLLLSIAVTLNSIFANKFTKDTVIRNPYSTVFNVLAYAIKNKVPKQRSAFTYAEQTKASRLDYAKHKYGGPYKLETVEDVKTFLRILAILMALFGFYLAYPSVRDFMPTIMNQFKGGATALNGYGSYLLWQVLDVVPIGILVPLFELVLLPLFPKLEFFLMKPLRGLVINHILLLISVVSLFVISTVGYLTDVEEVPCYTIWMIGDPTITFSYFALTATAAISGFADNFSFLYAFEFICSQAPSDMNGMLIGLFWCLRGTWIQINYFLTLPLSYHPIRGTAFSCGFWVTLLPLIFCTVGLFCFTWAVNWYHKRERDDSEELNFQINLEKHFDRYFDQQDQFNEEQGKQLDCDYFLVIETESGHSSV